MSLCPKDGKACMDDLCHGSGCMRMGGYPMLDVCNACGQAIDPEDNLGCACDGMDEGYDRDECHHGVGFDEDCEWCDLEIYQEQKAKREAAKPQMKLDVTTDQRKPHE